MDIVHSFNVSPNCFRFILEKLGKYNDLVNSDGELGHVYHVKYINRANQNAGREGCCAGPQDRCPSTELTEWADLASEDVAQERIGVRPFSNLLVHGKAAHLCAGWSGVSAV